MPVAVRMRSWMQTQAAIGGDDQLGLDRVAVGGRLEAGDRDARLVEQQLLGIGQAAAVEHALRLRCRAARPAASCRRSADSRLRRSR